MADWVVVVFAQSIKLFHFAKGFTRDKVVEQYPIRKIEGGANQQGQIGVHVSEDGSQLTLCYQSAERPGKVEIVTANEQVVLMGQTKTAAGIKDAFVYASDGKETITGISFSQDGTLLHVSVNQGTLLNTYSVSKRELIKQLGRGKQGAMVNSISSNGTYLASCSDRGTTHLYNVASSMAQSQNLDQSQPSQVNASADSGNDLKQSQSSGGGMI